MKSFTIFRVGPTDTDSYNIVHHPQYCIWCEQAVLEWLENCPEIQALYGQEYYKNYTVQNLACKFNMPARLRDTLKADVILKKKDCEEDANVWAFHVRLENTANRSCVADCHIRICFIRSDKQ